MNNNIYGIDLGTCNFKVFCTASGKIFSEKNTIAVINKNQIYAYGDDAYAMYEKAPETIHVSFPVSTGVIADYNFLQTMMLDYLETKLKCKTKNAEFLVAFRQTLPMWKRGPSLNCFTKANPIQRASCSAKSRWQMQ